jgi:hypothetical protein
MNFSSLYPLLVEKANDDSSLVAVEHCENFKPHTFSVKKDVVMRRRAWERGSCLWNRIECRRGIERYAAFDLTSSGRYRAQLLSESRRFTKYMDSPWFSLYESLFRVYTSIVSFVHKKHQPFLTSK